MSTKTRVNIGLVGCGYMSRAHSNAFAKVNQFFDLDTRPILKAACARNPEAAEASARNWGYESFETDWRALLRRPDIDLIDIASPTDRPRGRMRTLQAARQPRRCSTKSVSACVVPPLNSAPAKLQTIPSLLP
jgi:hypothetical protein